MHNFYLQTALDTGLFGLAIFLCFLVSLLRWTSGVARALRRDRRGDEYLLVLAIQIMMVTVLLYGLQVDVFFFPLKAWWLSAGIVVALHTRLARANRDAAGRRAGEALSPAYSVGRDT